MQPPKHLLCYLKYLPPSMHANYLAAAHRIQAGNYSMPEEAPEHRNGYYEALPPRLREAYVDVLNRMQQGDCDINISPDQQQKLDEYNVKFPRTKPRKRP